MKRQAHIAGGAPDFEIRLAETAAEREASQRLRYAVFVEELGADGASVDHSAKLEMDAFDDHLDHLLLFDHARPRDPVVGVYRLMREDQRPATGQFYSEDEFDLLPLLTSGRRLLELGRSCVHPDYRGGPAMYHLWQGIADYVAAHGIEILFGVASFHGTDPEALAQPLSHLHHAHLAPAEMRPRARVYQPMNLLEADEIDRPTAVRDMPALIKAYLRLGGVVGDGAFIDHDFNTTDICLIMDTATMSGRHKAIYTRQRASV